MGRQIIIQKATRVEGNADIHIEIDENRVKTARFMVHDFRGFEKFICGKQAETAPHIISRICGLCCVAHQAAGFQAIENALEIEVPPAVEKLRAIAVLGERISSHALSYFFLTLPDLMGETKGGGIFDLIKQHPEIAADGFFLRKSGNRVAEIIGKRAVHPVAMGAGKFYDPPNLEDLEEIHSIADEVKKVSLKLIKKLDKNYTKNKYINFPSEHRVNFLSYDESANSKPFKIYNITGEEIESFSFETFADHISEMRVDWSFAKFPYLTSQGFPQGIILVGPLSRIFQNNSVVNVPELADFKMTANLRNVENLCLDDFDICRLLEIFMAAKQILSYLEDIDLSELDSAEINFDKSGDGFGVVEAPRGALVHNYVIKRGVIESVRLLVATQFNNAFINFVLKDLADNNVENNALSQKGEELLSRCVRVFDPCLTCATH